MPFSIIIKELQLNASCGVTEHERSQPQTILVDLTMRCINEAAFQSDKLSDTLDYAVIAKCLREISEKQSYSLLEKLTNDLCLALFQQFPLTQLTIWVRKVCAPIENFSGSVGIRLTRSRLDILQQRLGQPSPFLLTQLSRLPRGRVLDVATGRGRHAHVLATHGFTVHGVDYNREALETLNTQAKESGDLPITTQYLDLETDNLNPPDFGTETYDVILVFFYLYRPLFPQLIKALKPGGVILYETFLLENHLQRNHPRRKEFCLQPNELLNFLTDLQILHYEEGDHRIASQTNHAFTARAFAQKHPSRIE